MSLMFLSSFCDVETDPLKLGNFPQGTELVSIWVRNQSETDSMAVLMGQKETS